ncbi:hypothetical protein QE152_g19727 [Popillia japonica]|uniref:Transposable element P transposase-like RNase H domain-containing protein n=1 Tax=Popillia japonica TaxID=7064 RepID=A0AAW1KN48_POPJA
MSIREQLVFDNNVFYGGVSLGTETNTDNDNATLAKNALVFMAVAINKGWKVPLGYFLIKSLTGNERANLLNKCLQLLYETGARVYSVTVDGAPVNMSMCTTLGAHFTYGSNFKPYFSHPIINYILNLKDISGTPIIESNRKTGFLGLIICLTYISFI